MLPNSEKDFLKRHIGPSKEDQLKMLKEKQFQKNTQKKLKKQKLRKVKNNHEITNVKY